jgi:RNA polymerase subunit RPABC4/transcription elongation factor Spt4
MHGMIVEFASLSLGLARTLALVAAFCAAFLILLWASLIIWAWRDARARTQHVEWAILAALLVAALWLPGVLLYVIVRPKETSADEYIRQMYEASMISEYESQPRCPACHHAVSPKYQLCPSCGTRQRQPCAYCSRLLLPQWRYCPYCTAPVTGHTAAGTTAEPASA